MAAPAAAADDPVEAAKSGPLSASVQQLAEQPGADTLALTRPNGDVVLNIRLSPGASKAALREVGARIRFSDPALDTVAVSIAPGDIDALASVPGVESVTTVLKPLTNAAACPTGPFVSEALTQLRADMAAADFHVSGRDVTVGVLSDSLDSRGGLAQDVADGELPGTANPCAHSLEVRDLLPGPYGDDEGRAMAQLVHDLAPDAEILFASAFISPEAFAQGIRDLADAGADVIVDDVSWLNEPMYQDGVIGKAVEDVTAAGVTYFSSAANSNLTINGNRVASYEAMRLRETGCPASVNAHYGATPVACHDFDPGLGVDPTYGLQYQGGLLYLLGWSQPRFGITDDLDLCLLDGAGELRGCARDNNLTTQEAFEYVYDVGGGLTDAQLVVVHFAGSGSPRLKLLSMRSDLKSVEYATGRGTDVVGPTIFGHNASRSGATVAAVEYTSPNALEWYSSWGPAAYCWGPVEGTQPASAWHPCKSATVDMTATDGVQNSFFGLEDDQGVHRFYGTSAAAPHAAAVAALILDRQPCLAPSEILAAMKTTGVPVSLTPVNGAGGGLVDARAALAAVGDKACDSTPPRVEVKAPSGWQRTAVTIDVSASDRRTVTAIDCGNLRVEGLTGAGTPKATARATVEASGVTQLTCTAVDAEGNRGAAEGSTNSTIVKIDRTAPVLTCQPTTVHQGQAGTVSADVTDAESGPATATASVSVPTATLGNFNVTISGKDLAGNTGTSVCGYTVSPAPDSTAPTMTCRPLTLRQGQTGTLVADVTDRESGPATPKVSVPVKGTRPGSFRLALTASDIAGNTATKDCAYRVIASKPKVRGPSRAIPGSRQTYIASGFWPGTRVVWKLRHEGTTVARIIGRVNDAGRATVTLLMPDRAGRYSVKATAAGGSAGKKVLVS